MEVDAEIEPAQIQSLRKIKASRSLADLSSSLDALRKAAAAGDNVMPALLQAADARATVQECMDAFAEVFGRFRPSASW
jgi:methylmalonyl-CoA mutase N-terminal domain/subunit